MTRLLYLAPALLLTACASTTEVKTRHVGADKPATAHHILLAARSPDADKRADWEKECKHVLQREGLKITRGQRAVPGWQEPGSGALEQWAREHEADAIVLADITGLLIGSAHIPEQDPATGEPQMQAQWTFYFGGDAPEKEKESVYQTIDVEWIAPDGKRFWTGVARTHEAHELNAVARSQCRALGKTLTERGLLPRP